VSFLIIVCACIIVTSVAALNIPTAAAFQAADVPEWKVKELSSQKMGTEINHRSRALNNRMDSETRRSEM
jgi:hypothetical protein